MEQISSLEQIASIEQVFKCIYNDLHTDLHYGFYALILFAIVLLVQIVLAHKIHYKKLGFSLLIAYGYGLIALTFMNRELGSRVGLQLKPFETIQLSNAQSIAYAIENIILFLPFGFLIPSCFSKLRHWYLSIPLGIVTSVLIEFIQYKTQLGFCQIDDVMTNTVGTILGYLIFALLHLTSSLLFVKQQRA